jgi:hypothetical protein
VSAGGRGKGNGRSDARQRDGTDPPAVGPSAPLTSSILSADELAQVQAAQHLKEAKAARARELEAYRAQQTAANERAWQEARDEADRKKLQALGRIGPCLPPYKRRAPRLYAQEEDLEDLIPDGWGSDPVFREDAKRLAARVGFSWGVVMVLVFVEWFHGLRPAIRRSAHGTGGALQASPEFIGRKLGLDERTVQRAQRTLDPLAEWRRECAAVAFKNATRDPAAPELPQPPKPMGTVYVGRFPQLKLYAALTADLPPDERFRRWLDKAGELHEWVDLTGVYFPTYIGVRALRRRKRRDELRPTVRGQSRKGRPVRHRPGLACAVKGCGRDLYRKTGLCRRHFDERRQLSRAVALRSSPMQRELYRLLRPLYRRLRARLAPRPLNTITPNNVHRVETDLYLGPGGAVDKFDTPDATGPPGHGRPARLGLEASRGKVLPSTGPPEPSSQALPVKLSGLGAAPPVAPSSSAPASPRPPRTLREAQEAWASRLAELGAKRRF